MLEDIRKQADTSSSFEKPEEEAPSSPPPLQTASRGRFLGMTPFQRFFIALMLFILACLLSIFCLLVTGRVIPPFLS